FVVERRAPEGRDGLRAVDGAAVDRRLEGLVPRLLHARGDAREGPVPRLLFPGLAAGRPVEHLLEPPRIVHDLDGGRALAAQGAFADGVAGVTFDVDDGSRLRGNDLAAADAAEGADRRGRSGAESLERWNRGAAARLSQGPNRHRTGRQSPEELATCRP